MPYPRSTGPRRPFVPAIVLRHMPGLREQKCQYDPRITADVIQAFVSENRVRVIGVRPPKSSVVSAAQIVPVGSPPVVVQA